MQFHVPFQLAHPPTSATSASPFSPHASAAGSSPLQPNGGLTTDAAVISANGNATAVSRSVSGATGVAVGQGLLSGRRLAVRLGPPHSAPPAPSASPPPALQSVMGNHSEGLTASHSPVRHESHQGHLAPTVVPSSPPPASRTAYGGGIVRISDLRRQGAALVESGLRLTTLEGGRPAASLGTTTVTTGRAARVGRGARDTNSSSSNSVSAETFHTATDLLSTTASRDQRPPPSRTDGRRGAGSRASTSTRRRGSRGSTEVTLTETGELCDYRWFMARGRRCFIYDGKTYKGSKAHTMWNKVKEIANRRGQETRPPAPAAAAPARRAPPATRARAATPAAAPRPQVARRAAPSTVATEAAAVMHRTSARAASAAHRSLALDHSTTLAIRGARDPAPTPISRAAPLREEWQTLLRELSVELEDEEGDGPHPAPVVSAFPSASASPATAPTSRLAAAPSALRGGPSGDGREVVEIVDSDGDGCDSNTHDSSSVEKTRRDRSKADLAAVPSTELRWPATSFFSDDDESSGWSSTSQPSAPHSETVSPARKRVKAEGPPPTTTPLPFLYNGMKVVEEDGWVYPIEVYASQQQRRGKADHRKVPSATDPESKGSEHAPLRSVDDLPLSDLFSQPSMPVQPTAATRLSRSSVFPPPPPTPASSGAAGIAVVVSGSGSVVPLRPGVVAGAPGRAGDTASAGARSVVSGLLSSDGADLLDGFNPADLADLFVTGEEIGGMRYGS